MWRHEQVAHKGVKSVDETKITKPQKEPARQEREDSIMTELVLVFVVGGGVGLLYALIRFVKWLWAR